MKLQPAVRKETGRILTGTAVCTALMLIVFYVLHVMTPESVPFDYRVVLSAIVGGLVAALNFFFMAVAVQKVAATENEDRARQVFTVSFRFRMLLQFLWGILTLVLPCCNGAAGIIPLFFPSLLIKAMGVIPGSGARRG